MIVELPAQLTAEATTPSYAHDGDAGLDLHSIEGLVLRPGERRLVGTGVSVEIPTGHVGLIAPRSGLAKKEGVTVLNAPAVIDSGYRGELKVLLVNTDRMARYQVRAGDRIAQLLIVPVVRALVTTVERLAPSERGEGGFGSTGRA